MPFLIRKGEEKRKAKKERRRLWLDYLIQDDDVDQEPIPDGSAAVTNLIRGFHVARPSRARWRWRKRKRTTPPTESQGRIVGVGRLGTRKRISGSVRACRGDILASAATCRDWLGY